MKNEIVNGWESVKLEGAVTINSGESPSKFKFSSSGVPYYKVEQLNSSRKYLSESPYKIKTSKTIPEKSIIFPKRGASILLNKIRILATNAFMDTNLMTLTVKGKFDEEFLFYALVKKELWRIADTTSIPQINNKHINPLEVLAPSDLIEQKKIAEALSCMDSLIEKQELLIKKKKDIRKGVVTDLVTGKKRLPDYSKNWKGDYKKTDIGLIPSDWDIVSYGDAFTFLSTSSYSRSELSSHGDVYYIHYGDIHKNFDEYLDIKNTALPCLNLNQKKNYSTVKKGDLVMADASEDYDGICKTTEIISEGPVQTISGLHTFLLRDSNNIFSDGFRGLIHQNPLVIKSFRTMATGLKVYGVTKNNLKKILIPYPTNISEQKEIANVASSMREEIISLEKKLEKYQKIKQGMMQSLLSGEIRLV